MALDHSCSMTWAWNIKKEFGWTKTEGKGVTKYDQRKIEALESWIRDPKNTKITRDVIREKTKELWKSNYHT